MRPGDVFREVFYPTLVFGLIGTVWCVAQYMPGGGDRIPQRLFPPLNPALSQRALIDYDAADRQPTTAPTRVSSIDPNER